MIGYWLSWFLLTLFKGVMLTGVIFGAIGGIMNMPDYLLLVILFVPVSMWLLTDFIYQLLIPKIGGVGWRLHRPIDTPMYMGLAPSCRAAKEILRKGQCIIWD